MPTFRYRAVSNQGGDVLSGVIEAPSRELAVARLQNTGYLPISAEQLDARRSFDLTRLSIWRRGNRISRKNLALFTRELATLLQAGLPLEQALQTLRRLNQARPLLQLADELLESIRGGARLSDALAEKADVFGKLYINMVRAGEASGALEVIIGRLADYLERMNALRSYVAGAMVYPAILLGFSVLSLFILITFVVPEFVPLFEDSGQTLPWLTQGVFAVSSLFRQYGWSALPLAVIALWFMRRGLAEPALRLRFDSWCLRLPGIGAVIRQLETARLCRTLGTALGNGVPLLAGIALVREVVGNRRMAAVMDSVQAGLEQGQPMSKPLAASGVYPELATQLIAVGEAGGQLDTALDKVAEIYDKEVQAAVKRLLTVLEPILILGLGALIALIIISVLLAVLSLNALVL